MFMLTGCAQSDSLRHSQVPTPKMTVVCRLSCVCLSTGDRSRPGGICMSDQYTYEFPEPTTFLYTLRKYLKAQGHDRIAVLLSGATCEFSGSNQYGGRWNSLQASIQL